MPAEAAPPELADTAVVDEPPPPQGHWGHHPPPPPPPPAAAEAVALLVPTGAPETAVGVATDVAATAVVATGAVPTFRKVRCHQHAPSTCNQLS